MSGLEKFQAKDGWRCNFKNYLLIERKPPAEAVSVKEAQRFSLDLSEDLLTTLKEKKIPKQSKLQEKGEQTTMDCNQEDKENKVHIPMSLTSPAKIFKTKYDTTPTKSFNKQSYPSAKLFPKLSSVSKTFLPSLHDDSTIQEDLSLWQRTTDESFEAVEKMCDKTASDPNSTLFHYLKSSKSSEAGGNSISNVRPPTYDEEAEALQRLLDELNVEEQKNAFDQIIAGRILANETLGEKILADETQLDAVEEPSRFWENTITEEKLLRTSPVKMVGLLRPSTIIEEFSDISDSEVNSSASFQSALKGSVTSETTGCYETANDYESHHTRWDKRSSSELHQDEDLIVRGKNDSGTVQSNNESEKKDSMPTNNNCIVPNILITGVEEHEKKAFKAKIENELLESDDLIDLEETFAALRHSPHSTISSEESVIEILSEDEEECTDRLSEDEEECTDRLFYAKNNVVKEEKETITDMEVLSLLSSVTNNCISSNENRQEELHEHLSEKDEDNSLSEKDEDNSLDFNDTIEEVEYMMKKGMQYMAAASNSSVKGSNTSKNCLSEGQQGANTLVGLTPALVQPPISNSSITMQKTSFTLKTDDHYSSPSTKFRQSNTKTTETSQTVRTKAKPSNRLDFDIKPFPKFELFKKPSEITSHNSPNKKYAQHKAITTTKKQTFAHIVSPIGTYIKKTPTTPLMTTIKSTSENFPNSTTIRKLDYESRFNKPKFDETARTGSKVRGPLSPNVGSYCSLPKKAYISSEFKHIVDERTPLKIPGGPKIQQYLAPSLLSSVVRHDGKIKVSSSVLPTSAKPLSKSQIPRRKDDSLADLSLMSGDVSLYTIKDAQKF